MSATTDALGTALAAEHAAIWRVALGPTTGDDRRAALDALTDCALRAARWRRAAGTQPGTVPLP